MVEDPLSAVQRSQIRRMSEPKEPDEAATGELNVVPFLDIITNVMMFVLATVAITFTATLDINPPRGIPRGEQPAPLGLTVLIVPDGFSVKAKGGNVAPGCDSLGAGLAVGKTASRDYDYASLGKCVSKLKASSDAFADESSITISADPQIPYQDVIGVMDAVRKTDDGKDLFADVSFGLVR